MDELEYRFRNWDSRRWEEEICRDEKRISGYFSELASCLDLPGEERLIFETLKRRNDTIPAMNERDWKRTWCYFCDADDERDDAEVPPAGHEEEQIVTFLDGLVTEWNLAGAVDFPGESIPDVLAIGCAYSRLLSRTMDFLDSDPETESELKIALARRILSDLSCVIKKLQEFSRSCPSGGAIARRHNFKMLQFRMFVTEMINDLSRGGK